MNSNVIIKFNNSGQDGDNIRIQDLYTPSVLMSVEFSLINGSSTIPVTNNIDTDIYNFSNFLQLTYNATSRYVITTNYTTKEIEILDKIGASTFVEQTNNTSGRLVTTIINQPVYIPVSISQVTLSENSVNPCSLVDINIETNKQVTGITSPVIQPVSTNPFTITDIPRDSITDILISVNDGISSDAESIFVPILSPSIFNLSVTNTPTTASVNVTTPNNPYFSLQYSLDNVVFYDSSSFSGLVDGNYTMYIKDDIGCSTSIPFEVTAFDPNVYERLPYFNISEQNSLITVLRQNVDEVGVFKNPLNTLSYEELTQVNNRSFKQLFQKKDGVIKQQYRSNYNSTEVKLIDCDGNETILVSEKKSNNFDVTDVRDVKILSVDYLGGAFVGVQYGVGNTYDPDTLVVNGSYNLGTEVPDFMNVDDYIQIEGAGWFKVANVSYYDGVETLVLDALVNSFPIQVTGQTLKGTAIYNKLPYELYEFSFDCNTLDGDYYITYETTDSEFDSINNRTEWFNISDAHLNTYLLQYYNTENNETNYSTGITNKLRIKYVEPLYYAPSDTQDIYLTDTNAVNIESTYRDLYNLDCYPVPMNFIRKIGLAVSNDRLFINGLSLLKNSELETEKIGQSNLYRLTIQFIRSDYAFTNIADDGSVVLPSGDILGADDNTEEVLGTKDNQ